MNDPYLSLVVTARNDDHGGNLLGRMQIFVSGWLEQARRYGIRSELIIVEWNPPADRPQLVEALSLPQDCGPCIVRFIEVPPELHRRYPHSDGLPLYQMIGKNVGIRRARGRFVLATNIDLLFSNELADFLARENLDPDCMYRIDRHDAISTVPPDASVDEQLAYCRTNLIRVNRREGTFPTSLDGTPNLSIFDVITPDSDIIFGAGWFPLEWSAREPFRWARERTEVLLPDRPDVDGTIVMDIEPGPATGSDPLDLEISFDDESIGRVTIDSRSELRIPLYAPLPKRLVLRSNRPVFPVGHDPRILCMRVFRIHSEFHRSETSKSDTPQPDPPKSETPPPEPPKPDPPQSEPPKPHLPKPELRKFEFRKEAEPVAKHAGPTVKRARPFQFGTYWAALQHLIHKLATEGPLVQVTVPISPRLSRLLRIYVSNGGVTGLWRRLLRFERPATGDHPAIGEPARIELPGTREPEPVEHLATSEPALTELPATGEPEPVESLATSEPAPTDLPPPKDNEKRADISVNGQPASDSPAFLHTNACGDFTLLSRDRWFDIRGYAEFDVYSMNLDSVLCYAAYYAGATEQTLCDPMRIYHIEHGSGWTPEGYEQLFARLAAKGITFVHNDEVLGWASQMNRLRSPIIFNHENWGLIDFFLKETVLGSSSRQKTQQIAGNAL